MKSLWVILLRVDMICLVFCKLILAAMLRMNCKGQKVRQGGQLDHCNAVGECGWCRGSRVAEVETEMWVDAG